MKTARHPLQTLPLLSRTTQEDWARFAKFSLSHSYRQGNVLFYQGNPCLGLHFITSGRVKLVKEDRAGRRQIVRIVEGPDMLGDRAFFAERAYACTSEIMEDSEISFMSPANFWDVFGRNSNVLRLLAQRFARELGRAEEYMHCIAVCTVNARLATRLLKFSRRQEKQFVLGESRTELAQVLGTTPEAVSRTLAKLSSKGLISISGRSVRVLNVERLSLSACLHDSLN